jgi:hypothetical protein
MKLRIPYWYLLAVPTFLYYLGGFFNLGVMALNHGQMPVLMPSDIAAATGGFDDRHVLMTSATHLKFFCDWLNLGDGIASPGDILVWIGAATTNIGLALWAALMIKDVNSGDDDGRR